MVYQIKTEIMRNGETKQFGHAKHGWAVEFNLDGVCACRTLTMETKAEAETFKQLLERQDGVNTLELVQV